MTDGSTFASDAGSEVCPQCGRDAYGTWCECGFELTSVDRLPTREEFERAAAGASAAGSGEQPAPPPAAAQRWIIIGAALVFVIGVAIAILLIAVGEPTSTSGP